MDSTHISESTIYGSSWGTPKIRELFKEKHRVSNWLRILSTLAVTQAEYNLIPTRAAEEIIEACDDIVIDEAFLEEIKDDFLLSNHSLIGFIRAVKKRCGEFGGEWLCYGVTVQDITDTQLMMTLKKVKKHLLSELQNLEQQLALLARQHQSTYMLGRTHGQSGLPITFGFKLACWLDEIHRHKNRLLEVCSRMFVGQLCGGVGSLSSLGPNALDIQTKVMEQLDLDVPVISWTSTRDRLAEWMNLMALLAATGDRIGHEIYNLQRSEISEVSEGFVPGTIGSITMPHKRNPEISEHLGTLARIVRHDTAHMLENIVHDHERDGRSWKGEWWIIPPACMATEKVLSLLNTLFENLQINQVNMQKNIDNEGGFIYTESVMLALASKIGKNSAHQLIYELSMAAKSSNIDLKDALVNSNHIQKYLSTEDLEKLFDLKKCTGHCAAMVNNVLDKIYDE